ncbi:MAG: hypothetical protein ACW99F_05925 [Candidatus Hodarchaeales archaeon]
MTTDNNSSFKVNIQFEQKISGFKKIHLSLSQYTPPAKKELMGSVHTKIARKTPLEHVERLFKEGRLKNLHQPLLIISVRNVLANLRCIAYLKGITQKPISVAEESKLFDLSRNGNFPSNRPYHILGEKNDRLVIEEWEPKQLPDYTWFLSGIPVLWDDKDEEKLYQKIVTEAADHSHVWHIPRGNHPEATDKVKSQWQYLQKLFYQSLAASRSKAFRQLEGYAKKQRLIRENAYLHNILGLDEDGNLRQLIGLGKLENLGQKIKNRGVRRALCVDNGGSISVEFYQNGLSGARDGDYLILVAAPNHRFPGTSYLIVELKDSKFSYL